MSDEWWPWVEHDGKGCPCVGAWVETEMESPLGIVSNLEGIAGSSGAWSWDRRWFGKTPPGCYGIACRVIRYRIRKPRGLTVLEELLADLPEEVAA